MRIEGDVVSVARALRYRTLDDRISECWLYEHDQQLVDRAWSGPIEETPTSGSV